MTSEGYPKMEDNPKIFMIERFRLQKSCWLVKVINTATGDEALILSMYTNYFDGTVCIGESVLHFEKASKFHGYNFQIESSTDVFLCGWILLSIKRTWLHTHYTTKLSYVLLFKSNMCVEFSFFQSVKRLNWNILIHFYFANTEDSSTN